MACKAQRVTVGTTATQLDVQADADYEYGQHLLVRNRDATNSVYLGGSGVTTAQGFELKAGESFAVDLGPTDHVYGRVASGTVDCDSFQAGV